MAGIADFIPNDDFAFIKNAPSVSTRRVYGRIVFADDSATTTPPSVTLVGLPAYSAADQVSIYNKPYDAKLVDPLGTTPMAGIWYADIPVYDDPDLAPAQVWATISHPDWTQPETRRAKSTDPLKVAWVDLDITDPTDMDVPAAVVWVGAGGTSGPGTTVDSYQADIASLTDYPTSFPPATHQHPTSQVTGLDAALAKKADLDAAGKIPLVQLPSIAISDYLGVVTSNSAMLALTGQRGDYCTRTDSTIMGDGLAATGDWILTADNPTLLSSWHRFSSPSGQGVSSVNGKTGPAVTLTTDDVQETANNTFVDAADRQKLNNLPVNTNEALSLKAGSQHGHEIADINQLSTALNQRAPLDHSHDMADITGLSGALTLRSAYDIQGILDFGQAPPAGTPKDTIWAVRTNDTPPEVVLLPQLVGMSEAANNSTLLSVPIPQDGSIVAGDWAIFAHYHNPTDGAVAPASPAARANYYYLPSGWTGLLTSTISFDRRGEIYTKQLTAADISAGAINISYVTAQKGSGLVGFWRNIKGVTGAIVQQRTVEITKQIPTMTITKPSIAVSVIGERRSAPNQDGTVSSPWIKDGWVASTDQTSGGTAAGMAHQADVKTIASGATSATIGGGTWTYSQTTSDMTFSCILALEAI